MAAYAFHHGGDARFPLVAGADEEGALARNLDLERMGGAAMFSGV